MPSLSPSAPQRKNRLLCVMFALLVLATVALSAPDSITVGDGLPDTLNPLYGKTGADLRAQQLVFERVFFNTAIS